MNPEEYNNRERASKTLRRFAPDSPLPSSVQLDSWWNELSSPNTDKTSDITLMADQVFRNFLDSPSATISAMIVSKREKLDPFYVRLACRVLQSRGLLEETPAQSRCFRLSKEIHDEYVRNPEDNYIKAELDRLGYSSEKIECILDAVKSL